VAVQYEAAYADSVIARQKAHNVPLRLPPARSAVVAACR
jgi:hypothetical protein